jgi:hypothetical protein
MRSAQHHWWHLLSKIPIIPIRTLLLSVGFIASDSVVHDTILQARIMVEQPSVDLVL